MSASEKLRALEPIHITVDGLRDEYTLYDVPLPLITDVVEAAEAFTALPETSVADATAETVEIAMKRYAKLASTLTALQEHLEGQ